MERKFSDRLKRRCREEGRLFQRAVRAFRRDVPGSALKCEEESI